MARELKVSIPHQLGAEEAARRLRAGLDKMRADYGAHLSSADVAWTGHHADLRVGALGQTVTGEVDVGADAVEVKVMLPMLLGVMADKIGGFLQRKGSDSLRIEPPKKT